jgi:hypothetical protein
MSVIHLLDFWVRHRLGGLQQTGGVASIVACQEGGGRKPQCVSRGKTVANTPDASANFLRCDALLHFILALFGQTGGVEGARKTSSV